MLSGSNKTKPKGGLCGLCMWSGMCSQSSPVFILMLWASSLFHCQTEVEFGDKYICKVQKITPCLFFLIKSHSSYLCIVPWPLSQIIKFWCFFPPCNAQTSTRWQHWDAFYLLIASVGLWQSNLTWGKLVFDKLLRPQKELRLRFSQNLMKYWTKKRCSGGYFIVVSVWLCMSLEKDRTGHAMGDITHFICSFLAMYQSWCFNFEEHQTLTY